MHLYYVQWRWCTHSFVWLTDYIFLWVNLFIKGKLNWIIFYRVHTLWSRTHLNALVCATLCMFCWATQLLYCRCNLGPYTPIVNPHRWYKLFLTGWIWSPVQHCQVIYRCAWISCQLHCTAELPCLFIALSLVTSIPTEVTVQSSKFTENTGGILISNVNASLYLHYIVT